MKTIQTDVLVIGSGPGGYVAAVRSAQLGKKVICVEKGSIGGVCLNVGCIPSKAMISAAKNYDKLNHIYEMGIDVPRDSVTLDVKKLQRWKQSVVDKLTAGVEMLIRGSGGTLVRGNARFVESRLIEVDTTEGPLRIEAASTVIATGSRPAEVQGFPIDGKQIHDSTSVLAFEAIPKRLLVIGGGYIGLELGMMWAKLGSEVTIVEFTEQLLPGNDSELVSVVHKKASSLGIKIYLGHQAVGYKKGKQGLVVSMYKRGQSSSAEEVTVDCDHVLCAVGRKPNSEGLGLEKIGVQIDPKGFVVVDKQQRTSIAGVYAIGDVCGQPMLAHKASKEAEVAAEVIAGHRAEMDPVAIPAVIFTDPEIGSVGLTEAQGREQGYEVVSGKYSFSALGRSMASLETEGFVKIVADRISKQVLGVHVVGPSATDLISEGTFALEMGSLLPDLALTVHPHPTLGEAMMEAAKVALGESPHVLGKKSL